MRRLVWAVSAVSVVAWATGCGRKPDRDKAIPPARDSGIQLPSLDGLGLTKVAPLDESDGPPGAEKWLRKVTVDVPVEGSPEVADARDAAQWRGVALPRAENGPIPKKKVKAPPELRVRIPASGKIWIKRKASWFLIDFGKLVGELRGRLPDSQVVLDAVGAAPYGTVLPVMAVMAEQDVRFDLQAPPFDPTRKRLGELFDRLTKEAKGALKDRAGIPNVCARIRADARAPWRAVQGVMVAAMRAYVWRLSFIGSLDGREVEIGHVYSAPDQPPASGPVFVREEVGVVGELGIGRRGAGVYGFRTGGGRRRSVMRQGGSRASESAVDDALRWLAGSQEPDGRWSASRSNGAEGMDLAATGLATLSFLGAGHTEKTGKHKIAVRKAIKWIIGQQAGDGRIGRGTVKPGLRHAIAALALAEAYGMARMPMTGAAAQKAIDYAQAERADRLPSRDIVVTGWMVAQLRSSTMALLRVDSKRFQRAIATVDRTLGPTPGTVSYKPRKGTGPASTAIALFSLQMSGRKRGDPRLTRAADYVANSPPRWQEGRSDLHYWYWGSLAMFQMAGDHWWAWNKAMRDMLVEHQRKGAPDIDGSWDPMGGSLKDTGRVGSTAMAAMCLEVYYRYLPLYK